MNEITPDKNVFYSEYTYYDDKDVEDTIRAKNYISSYKENLLFKMKYIHKEYFLLDEQLLARPSITVDGISIPASLHLMICLRRKDNQGE